MNTSNNKMTLVCIALVAGMVAFCVMAPDKDAEKPAPAPAKREPVKPLPKIKVVIATQPGCPPCEQMRAVLGSTPFEVVWEDITQAGNTYDVRATPTSILLIDGKEVARKEGAMGREEFIAWVVSNNR